MRRDKQRRIEFLLRKKQPDLPQDAPPTDCLSTESDAILEERGEGGSKREMEKNDNEANGTQEEVTLKSLMEFAISMHEKLETALEGLANDPERQEGEG